jgi:negative regulator of genetic competence, sporulation and motility
MSTGPTGLTLRSSNRNIGDTFEEEDEEDQEDQEEQEEQEEQGEQEQDQEDQEQQEQREYQASINISSFIEDRIALRRCCQTTMATINKVIKGYHGNPISDDDEEWRLYY